MRHVSRAALPKATARALKVASEALTEALKRGDDPPIGGSYKSRGIQKVLRDAMFEGLCCFCECETELGNYGQVEHYRPKGRAEFKHLAYTWENLLWACGRCNGPKGDEWNPAAPLLDPTTDDPSIHLRWIDAKLLGRTARGSYTIDLLDLNGVKDLRRYEARRDHLEAARLALEVAVSGDVGQRERARTVLGALCRAYRGMLAANGVAPT
jgi:uncharacterized protein (TIGR02646 family)